jgi:hypothetical protein
MAVTLQLFYQRINDPLGSSARAERHGLIDSLQQSLGDFEANGDFDHHGPIYLKRRNTLDIRIYMSRVCPAYYFGNLAGGR